jgi:anti-sigma factor (TIGR02949 family)
MLPILNLYTCNEALDRLQDYMDQELSDRETMLVKRHLKICHDCSKKFAFEAQLLSMVKGRLQDEALPDGLMARLSQGLDNTER